MVPQQHRTLQPSRCSQSVLPHWGINHVATRHLQATARSRPGTTRSRVATSTSHTAELRADTQWYALQHELVCAYHGYEAMREALALNITNSVTMVVTHHTLLQVNASSALTSINLCS